jgi:hypothetical protein
MLIDLKILNGDLELKYNEYTYEYTVKVDSDVNSLDISYKLQDDTYIDIRNNILNDVENIVYVDVYNAVELVTYTFYVYKEDIMETNSIMDYKNSLEVVNNEKLPLYKVQILTTSIFLIIVILFSIIFHKKRI